MSDVCGNPAGDRHRIDDGARRVRVQLTVDWGADDLRDTHSKPLVFCSFACLAGWAGEKAAQHDGVTVKDG